MLQRTARKTLEAFGRGEEVDPHRLADATYELVINRRFTERAEQRVAGDLTNSITQQYVDALASAGIFGETIERILDVNAELVSHYGHKENGLLAAFVDALSRVKITQPLISEQSLYGTVQCAKDTNLKAAKKLLRSIYEQGANRHFSALSISHHIRVSAGLSNDQHWRDVLDITIDQDAIRSMADSGLLFETIMRLADMSGKTPRQALLAMFSNGAGGELENRSLLTSTIELMTDRIQRDDNGFFHKLFDGILSKNNLGFEVSVRGLIGDGDHIHGYYLNPTPQKDKGDLVAVVAAGIVFNGSDPIQKAKEYFGIENPELVPKELARSRETGNLPSVRGRIALTLDELTRFRNPLVR